MSRFVVFNGITRYKPGGITKVNAEALNQVVASTNSIVAILGEADGGAPGAVSGIVAHDDPSRGTSAFRKGPLVDALRLAFKSSNDPDVPGGASRVLVYKTNQSTQASVSLPSPEASFIIGSLTVNDAEATGGSATTLIDTALGSSFADDSLNGKFLVLRPFTATAEVKVITDYVSSTQTMSVGNAWTVNPAALADYFVLDSEVYDASPVSGASGTVVTWANGSLVVDAHIGRWLFIQNSNAVSDYYLAQITDNNATTLTVTPALPALAAGAIAQILPNAVDLVTRDYGTHTNNVNVEVVSGVTVSGSVVNTTEFEGASQVSPEVGGIPFLKLLYKGGAASISDTVDVSPVVPNTVGSIELTTGGLTPSAHIGKQVYSAELDEYSTITANTATVLTISPGFSSIPSAGTSIQIRTVTKAVASINGASGVASSLSTVITGVSGDNLSVSFSPNMTIRQLQTAIQANTNYVATIPSGVNGDTLVASEFDFGPDTEVNIQHSANITTAGFKQDNQALVNYFNTVDEKVSATRATDGTLDGRSGPRVMSSPVYFSGGTRGVSTNGHFQAGLDALLLVRANQVVPLLDENLVNEGSSSSATFDSVLAQLGAHVAAARGAYQNTAGERCGFMGFRGTKAQVIAKSTTANDADIHLTPQFVTTTDSTGTLVEFGPRMQAVVAASMRAGVSEVGEPLTHKYLRVSSINQDTSWNPADVTDANDMIKAGVLFAERVDGSGIRWVRDLTTHVKDDNLAFSEGSVRDVVRYASYGLRKTLVDKFTGKKAKPFSAQSAKDVTASYLETLRGENIIVDSVDSVTGQIVRAYHNIKVNISGDVARVSVGIFPAVGINFVLNDIYLQLPSQSA